MILEAVHIHKKYSGGYTGKAKFSNEQAEIELTLLPQHVDLILNAYADMVIKSSEEVAQSFNSTVIDYFDAALLENKQPKEVEK